MLGFFVTNGLEDFTISNMTNNSNFSNIGFESFALSILLGAWCLTGFEAAADMSEETKKSEAESRAPSAVSFVPTPDDKIFTEISEKVVKSRLTKNKNSVCNIVV